MSRLSALALVAAGFVAAVAQVLVTRELMNVFFGDELCIGLVLAAWLMWEAVGSLVGASRSERQGLPDHATHFTVLQALIPVLLFAQIWVIRWVPSGLVDLHDSLSRLSQGQAGAFAFLASLLPTTSGEIIGIIPMTLTTVLVTAPVCILLGWQFTVGARIYARVRSAGAEAVGRSYVWDSVGHLAGGALLSCVFIYMVPPLALSLMAGALALGSAAILLVYCGPPSRVMGPMAAGLPIVFGMLLIARLPEAVREETLKRRWRERVLVDTRDTPYGNLTCTRQEHTHSFFSNGLLMFDNPSRVVDEWRVHVPMLQVDEPRKVLLIGGGIGGGLYEALKHDPERIDYVELDPWATAFAEPFVTRKDAEALHDKRVSVHYVDARLFVKRACAKGAVYDVIIIALPDPFTAQLSRFYSAEFFREARLCLSPTGVLSFQMNSSSDYLSGALLDYNTCLYRTAVSCFADVRVIPGDTATVLVSPRAGVLVDDWLTLLDRLQRRGVQTQELGFLLQDRLQRERIKYVQDRLHSGAAVRLNTDFSPIGYYYRQALSATWFHPRARSVFAVLGRLRVWHAIALLAAGFAALLPLAHKRSAMRVYAPVAVAAAGMASIVLEMTLILAFESLYGYVYHKIGLLFGAFMVGLAVGGTWMSRHLAAAGRPGRAMIHTQLAAAATAVAIPPVLLTLASPSNTAAVFFIVDVLFPFLLAVVGMTMGAIFTAAGEAKKLTAVQVGRRAGLLYSADLFGACVGALVATVLLIPILGIPMTCIVAGCLNLGASLLLVAHMRLRPR